MTTLGITPEQIIERIKVENPWWQYGKVDKYYTNMQPRQYFDLFKPLVYERDVKRAVVLMGPRRVGKTVILFHTIQDLIGSGIKPDKIIYMSIDTPIYNSIGLEQLLKLGLQASGNPSPEGMFVFFDEVQYLKNWEVHLKSLVDTYHHTKFIVSGSAAAALKLKSNESGAGRFTDFILPPLTFFEYLSLKGLKELFDYQGKETEFIDYIIKNQLVDKLNKHFIDYINYGGYPEVTLSERIQQDPGRFIKSDIVDKVLLRDLPSLYGIQDIQELNTLFTSLAYNTGGEVSLEELSKNSGIAKNTIKKYLTYLEAAFLIKIVHRIDNNAKKFKRANFFKVYLTNPSLRCALFSPIDKDDSHIGNLVETAIFSQWQHAMNEVFYYARWHNGEVDMVSLNKFQKPDQATEIKWNNKGYNNPSELKNILGFCIKNKLMYAQVTTLNIVGKKQIEGVKIDFIPASTYCCKEGQISLMMRSVNDIFAR